MATPATPLTTPLILIVNISFRIGFELLLKYLNAYKLPIYTMIGSKKMAPNQIKI